MPITWSLAEAAAALGGRLVNGADTLARPLEGAVVDHREVTPGCLFVALPGRNTHGRHFAAAAIAAGAAVVLLDGEAPAGVPAWVVDDAGRTLVALGRHMLERTQVAVAAVTGSVGKTSAKLLMEAVLGQRWAAQASPRSFNTEIGLPLAVLGLEASTRWFVAEMGMRSPGEIRRLCRWAPPHVAAITNIGMAHIGRLGSQEAILHAKAEILENLGADDWAVLNRADPWLRRLQPTGHHVLWYGEEGADLWAEDIGEEDGAVRFTLVGRGFREPVRLPWDGRHQVMNGLAAAGVGLAAGLTPAEAAAGLAAIDPDAGHFRRLQGRSLTILDDTFNASPDSMRAGLSVLARAPGRRVAVLGDMLELGDFEEAAHRGIGGDAALAADILVTVGERARWIAEASGLAPDRVYAAGDADEARLWLHRHLQRGDTVYAKASRAVGLNHLVKDLMTWDIASY